MDFFENKSRKGNCAITSEVTYALFKAKGEDVRVMSGNNIDPSVNYGCGHTWVEWIDSEGNEWVIDFNNVWSKKDWDATSTWTVNQRQDKP